MTADRPRAKGGRGARVYADPQDSTGDLSAAARVYVCRTYAVR
jgi:hypothetical protein